MPSYGYDGPIAANEWALMQQVIGIDYAVATAAACKVVANTSGAQVAAGTIGGWGVLDLVAAPVQVNLTKPGSGTAWWMIVARRNWSTKSTSFVAISAGTSRPSVLPTRLTTPGVQDDQPLALVGWSSTQSQPGSVVDMRVIGIAGQQLAYDTQTLQYLTIPGRQVRIGTATWVCSINGVTGVVEWVTAANSSIDTTTGCTASTGWSLTSFAASRRDNAVSVNLTFTRTGSNLTIPSDGDITNVQVATITNTALRPLVAMAMGGSPVISGYAASAGDVSLVAVAPGVTVKTGDTFRLCGSWLAAD